MCACVYMPFTESPRAAVGSCLTTGVQAWRPHRVAMTASVSPEDSGDLAALS